MLKSVHKLINVNVTETFVKGSVGTFYIDFSLVLLLFWIKSLSLSTSFVGFKTLWELTYKGMLITKRYILNVLN